MKIIWFLKFIFLIKTFEDSMDLLLLIKDNKSHMCTLKILTDLCFIKQKIKIKDSFVKIVYNALVVKIF